MGPVGLRHLAGRKFTDAEPQIDQNKDESYRVSHDPNESGVSSGSGHTITEHTTQYTECPRTPSGPPWR